MNEVLKENYESTSSSTNPKDIFSKEELPKSLSGFGDFISKVTNFLTKGWRSLLGKIESLFGGKEIQKEVKKAETTKPHKSVSNRIPTGFGRLNKDKLPVARAKFAAKNKALLEEIQSKAKKNGKKLSDYIGERVNYEIDGVKFSGVIEYHGVTYRNGKLIHDPNIIGLSVFIEKQYSKDYNSAYA